MPYKDPAKSKEMGLVYTRRYRARLSAKKIARLQARIDGRTRWPDVDLAWAAGMFEGEGTITITGARKYSRSVVCLTSTDFQIVQFYQDRWPGLVIDNPQRKAAHKPARTWRLQGNFIVGFLLDILPFLRTEAEREKAELVLESQRARWAGYRMAGHLDRIEKFKTRIRHLNLRGRPTTAGVTS